MTHFGCSSRRPQSAAAVPSRAAGYRCAGRRLPPRHLLPPALAPRFQVTRTFQGGGWVEPARSHHPARAPAGVPGAGGGHHHADTPGHARGHPRVEAARPGEAGGGRPVALAAPARPSPGTRWRAARASESGGRERAPAQPNHGAGAGGGCAGARAQPNQGARHQAPGWVRSRAGGRCSLPHSPERGQGRRAEAGPRPAPVSPPLPLTPPSSPPYLGHPAGRSQRPATPGPPTRP